MAEPTHCGSDDIDDEGFCEDCGEEVQKVFSEHKAESQFDDFLQEAYGTIEVCGMTMDAGIVLKECDNTAYREAFNNWTDAEKIEVN